jgi:hypothetical protein
MKSNTLVLLAFLATLTYGLSSCKKDKTTTQPTNNTTAAETGTWNLQVWDGAPASGTMVFTASTLDFNCTTYSFTETDSYTKSGSTYTFTKTGGASAVISGGNNWTMDTLTSNVLRMTSSFGLVVRATK